MPIATVDPGSYERFDLKSAPPDGFVMLRPLPYGMKLTRRSKATRMMMRSKVGNTPKQVEDAEQVFELGTEDEWAVAHDFAYCIGEHNLQNADGSYINFSKNTAMVLKLLDPKVGSELERLIDQLNNEEGEESLEDFMRRASTPSEDSTKELDMDGNVEPIGTEVS